MLVLALSGCIPEFENPLPPPAKLEPDAKILGNWISSGADPDNAQLSFFARDSGWVDILYVTQIGGDDGIDTSILEGYTTTVKKDDFICFRARQKDSDGKTSTSTNSVVTYLIAQYTFPHRRSLRLAFFSDDTIAKLITSGELKGRVIDRTNDVDSVIVTASSQELVTLISKKGVKELIDGGQVEEFKKAK